MNALEAPAQWPPPDEPPPSDIEVRWSRWPVIGLIPRWFLAWRRWSRHLQTVLEPIQNEIVTQLVNRTGNMDWPNQTDAAVVRMVARAIADEKAIAPPQLHPDDRLDLLFWGADDDMTPLVFSLALQQEFKTDITWDEMLEFYNQRKALGQFVKYCVSRIETNNENAA